MELQVYLYTCIILTVSALLLRDPLLLNRFRTSSIFARTDLWLFYYARRGKRFLAVDKGHRPAGRGPVVHRFLRIAANHVSIADYRALPLIYNHSTTYQSSTTKSDFYDAFVAPSTGGQPIRGMFNTRDKAEHTRKRKVVSNVFSQQRVRDFDSVVYHYITLLVQQLEKKYESGKGEDGKVHHLDFLIWANYWAFDLIGDLAFGEPFGMLESGTGKARYTSSSGETLETDAIKTINERGTVSAVFGCAVYLKPYAALLPDPFFRTGLESVARLSGIAIDRVNRRLDMDPRARSREDLLDHLVRGQDSEGLPLGRAELTVEALTQLIAGSDTTSNSVCHIIYLVCKHPKVHERLVHELTENNPDPRHVAMHDEVKGLVYLQAVIHESLRFHATSSIGLPRLVPRGGMTVLGEHFLEGTVLSVPTHTIHRDSSFWGPDADEFVPERWLKELVQPASISQPMGSQKSAIGAAAWQWNGDHLLKSFNVFSTGPRACIGRNLALLEVTMVVAALIRRFHFELENGLDQTMTMIEGFLVKPKDCLVKYTVRV